jgi:hypothetical protein
MAKCEVRFGGDERELTIRATVCALGERQPDLSGDARRPPLGVEVCLPARHIGTRLPPDALSPAEVSAGASRMPLGRLPVALDEGDLRAGQLGLRAVLARTFQS